MSGTLAGGRKAAKTIKSKNPNFYREIGSLGGRKGKADGTIKGFAVMDKQKVREAGRKGGTRSRRGSSIKVNVLPAQPLPKNPSVFNVFRRFI